MRLVLELGRCALFALPLLAFGCATGGGGGGRDAGGSAGRDSGPVVSRDGGPIGMDDSGNPGSDAGGTGTDAGRESDAGAPRDSGSPPVDAGRDAGPILLDSGPPPTDAGPPPCTSAADCNDGLVCNGTERCELGACVAGTPPTCDDGVACTRDSCVEPSAGTTPSCDYLRDDSLCPAGQSCGATGCISACGESPCRLVAPQCGCGTGQGCYLAGTTRSCNPAGSAAEGAACAAVNSCAPGLACLNVSRSTTAVNQCMRFCASDADCSGAGSICVYTIDDGAGGMVPGVRVCSRGCDPITSAGCTTSASCQIFQETAGSMRYFTDCMAPVGAGGQGASCADSTQCQRGFICLGTPGTCLRYCNAPGTIAGGGCSIFEACYGFTTPLIVGATEYGVCDLWP